ncbi:hypothetical protein AB0C04_30900 [Micromonospora sp. NPDC048909]|uniref:hypothetical protein n=1 Tax=Micromonospora sp. NPDC048909 TaxID=3155643 RepID=UPI0033D6DDC2
MLPASASAKGADQLVDLLGAVCQFGQDRRDDHGVCEAGVAHGSQCDQPGHGGRSVGFERALQSSRKAMEHAELDVDALSCDSELIQVFLVGIADFTIASIMCAVVPTMSSLIVARILQSSIALSAAGYSWGSAISTEPRGRVPALPHVI